MDNPVAPRFADNTYPHSKAIRDSAPVQRSPLGLWLLSDDELVQQVPLICIAGLR